MSIFYLEILILVALVAVLLVPIYAMIHDHRIHKANLKKNK
jgi:hypothetical protein